MTSNPKASWRYFLKSCRFGNTKKVIELLKSNVDIDIRDNESNTPLLLASAAAHDNVTLCRVLVERGADVLATNKAGMDCLMRAAMSSNLNVLEYLLSLPHHPDVNRATSGAYTCFLAAAGSARRTRYKILQLLLSHGAVPTTVPSTGDTALHLLLWSDFPCSTAELSLLLSAGVSVDAVNSQGRTPLLTLCCNHTFFERRVVADRHPAALAQTLIKAGADVHHRDKQACTPLAMAALVADAATVRVLLEARAAPGELTFGGNNALHLGVGAGKRDVVEVLLHADSEARARAEGCGDAVPSDDTPAVSPATCVRRPSPLLRVETEDGLTPLLVLCDAASEHDDGELVQLLLAWGALPWERVGHYSLGYDACAQSSADENAEADEDAEVNEDGEDGNRGGEDTGVRAGTYGLLMAAACGKVSVALALAHAWVDAIATGAVNREDATEARAVFMRALQLILRAREEEEEVTISTSAIPLEAVGDRTRRVCAAEGDDAEEDAEEADVEVYEAERPREHAAVNHAAVRAELISLLAEAAAAEDQSTTG